MSRFHTLQIKSIIKETPNAVSLLFDVPDHLKSHFNFKAGQYVTLKTTLNGEEVRRDYSLCTNPNSNQLKVVVKQVEGGTFSVFANQELKEGDALEVAGPNGRFIFEPESAQTRTVVAFAAGSGITPVMSIVKTLLEEEPNSTMILAYGNKTPEDTIFLKELIALKDRYDDRFLLKFVFSKTTQDDALYGRIEQPAVKYMLNQVKDHNTIDAFYLCGPEAMINNISTILTESGFDKSMIHYELFKPSSEAQPEIVSAVSSDGKALVKVTVDDEEIEFSMSKQKTILESALEHDVDAPYSCQGGICSTCIARLKEGQVEMRQNNILTDKEVAEGLILTCQSQPISDKVAVDYDDV